MVLLTKMLIHIIVKLKLAVYILVYDQIMDIA